MKTIKKSLETNGRTLTLETGTFASQANGAVLARYGDTMVLATVVCGPERPDLGYFPLSVEYVERLYAGGRIKGSRFIKREGRPGDEAILTARLVDRSIRPLFPKDYLNEVQVIITVLSVDGENDPDVLSIIAASSALAISDIPWNGPIGAVRIGFKEGVFLTNPQTPELEFSEMDLVISATSQAIVMVEAGAKEVSEGTILGAFGFAQEEIPKIISFINEFVQEAGRKKQSIVKKEIDMALKKEVEEVAQGKLEELVRLACQKKADENDFEELKESIAEKFADREVNKSLLFDIVDKLARQLTRKMILEKGKRPDGRKPEEIRPLEIQVGLLPRTHGSAMFKRGETQALTITTLGSPSLEQLIEGMAGEETKRYIHHYNMPPFSTGETGKLGWPSRREIGHGALAERALEPVIPPEDKFPYTIRLVSEIMSSNGSTSMASVCGSSLALMDAGVPITAPVAGLAMGLVTDEKSDKFVVLSDIVGLEDSFGDMDFKIAGTKKGITALQLDVKIPGITLPIFEKALSQAREGRIFILEKMLEALPRSRAQISKFAPKIAVLHIPLEKIGEVIGPGGKIIRQIISETGTTIDIEDDGTINIAAFEQENINKAVKWIEALTKEVKVGEILEGKVKRIQPFGAFVELFPGKEGLVHVSQMSREFISNPNDVVKIDQTVKVRVLEIDKFGRINLSMLFNEDTNKPREFRPHLDYGGGRSRFRFVPHNRFRRPQR